MFMSPILEILIITGLKSEAILSIAVVYGAILGRLSSDARQPEVDFLHSSAVILNKLLGKSSP